MNNEEIKNLCLREVEIVNLLKKAKYWQDDSCWKDYGDEENNYSVIGDQQDSAEGALVEKIINSVDAVLMRDCLRRQIHPESKDAPQSLQNALKKYFGIYEGKLANIDIKLRGSLAKNIALIATGEKKNPSYIIVDKGEGQSPGKFHDTFLSLRKGVRSNFWL